ncbi:MAG TPA: ATP-binding cassette domain-containing protein [Bryobacteraceae bacterium]|jgi:ATP-binding cassette subfamily B protein|nr:ATP-binding cassette domain-containing protein [Bryobacteraceae bacterium]
MGPELLAQIAWPASRVPEALLALCERTGLGTRTAIDHQTADRVSGNVDEVIQWHTEAIGCEADVLHSNLRDIKSELCRAYPAILQIGDNYFLAITDVRKQSAYVLLPDLSEKKVALAEITREIRRPHVSALEGPLKRVLEETGICLSRRAKAIELLLSEQLALIRFSYCWVLKPAAGEPAAQWLAHADAYRLGAGLLGAHTLQYCLWLASWAILGTLSFQGRLDSGWLLAWALLLVTLVPFRVLTTWLQGLLAISIGGALKRRLLLGALRLQPDEMRHQGIGSYLGQVLEAEAVETLALSGGIGGLLALIEVAVSAFVLGKLSLLLLAWCALTIFVCARFVFRYQDWTTGRMLMTQDLVERMVGHRTRLAQEARERWHEEEDEALANYIHLSTRVDATGAWLVTAITRGWLLAGLACLAPAIVSTKSSATSVAVLLGGVLLAQTGLKRITTSFLDICGAWISWKRIGFLFQAAERKPLLGSGPTIESHPPPERVLEAERLAFRYQKEGRAALQNVTLTIRRGDRILLEGPSGGGKTTLASLLSGVREPNAGLLLVNGLDRHTLGNTRWRKAIAAAPQFHENHILTETLAFNLLMGRRWPPLQPDMQEAEELCRELGLGDLLDRMPGGMLQMVGEGGWQLSHGERSRVYIARALLQESDLIILDESFAALDPENLQTALQCTLERAKTLMVIAHP